MFKSAIILYVTCYSLYILFSRQPDFFDGEQTTGTIHFVKDSNSAALVPTVQFSDGRNPHSANAAYIFRSYVEAQKVPVIYEASQPEKAVVFSWWGYWITWTESLFSLLILVVFYFAAVSITSNPDAETVKAREAYVPQKRRKYED